EEGYNELFRLSGIWQQRWRERPRPYLKYRKSWATIRIEDGRKPQARTYTYSDATAALYEYCADARSRKELEARFDAADWVGAALDEFVERDLLIYLDGRYLSLALPANPNF